MRTSKTAAALDELLDMIPDELPSERCCGAACDQPQRDNELKLIGVREFVRLYKRTVVLTDAQKHCIDTVVSEYNMALHPLK